MKQLFKIVFLIFSISLFSQTDINKLDANGKKIGLWKLCPNTKLDTSKPADTGPVPSKLPSTPKSNNKCDPNYQGCIPPYPPDLDCTDIKRMKLAPIRVIGVDVHKFDGDGDGIGCDK